MSRRARRHQRRRSLSKWLLIGCFVLALPAMGAAGVGAVWVLRVYDSAPALDALRPLRQTDVSTVYAADGSRLGAIHFDTVRDPVPGTRIAPALRQATVAIEDRNFYREGGIDPKAIVRASWRDLLAGGKPVQGGSTITQQLVRDLYIKHPSDTLKRKIIEAHLADEENARYSKASILTQYLNSAPYGTNGGLTAVGVQAAAETYFSTPARRLTLREAALLAGLPQAPSDYNPLVHPRLARERRDEVLRAMRAQGYISARQLARARPRRARAAPVAALHARTRAVRLRPGAPRARASLRARHGEARRAEGLHDDPAAARGGRAASRRRVRGVLPRRWAGVGAGVGRPVEWRHRRARVQSARTRPPASSTSPRRRIASPARRSRRSC